MFLYTFEDSIGLINLLVFCHSLLFLLGNPPLNPPPLTREGEDLRRGAKPLLNTPVNMGVTG
jgi:hypothetical protein